MMFILYDVAYDIHTKACSFSYRFGGEEVLKELLFYFFVHANTIVSHRDDAVVILLADANGGLGIVIRGSTLRFLP